MFDTIALTPVRAALTGLAARQRVIADNLANVQTPGFLAGRVMFEEALQGATDGTNTTAYPGYYIARSLEPTRMDGNNVNLDHEVISNVDTNLRYQLLTRSVDDRYNTLRSAVR